MIGTNESNIGAIVHLNSGSPDLKVVAKDANHLTVEWRGESGLERLTLPEVCFRLVNST